MTTDPSSLPTGPQPAGRDRRRTGGLTFRVYQVTDDGERTELIPTTELDGDDHPGSVDSGWPLCRCGRCGA